MHLQWLRTSPFFPYFVLRMILTIEMEQRNFQEYYIRFVSFGGYSENVVLYSRSQFNAATYIRRCQYNFFRGIAFQMPNTRNMIVFAGTVMHSLNLFSLFIHAKLVIENSTIFFSLRFPDYGKPQLHLFLLFIYFCFLFAFVVTCTVCIVCMSYTHILTSGKRNSVKKLKWTDWRTKQQKKNKNKIHDWKWLKCKNLLYTYSITAD